MTKYELVATFCASTAGKSAPRYSVRPVTVLFEGTAYTANAAHQVLIGLCDGEQFRGDPADFYDTEAAALAAIPT